MKHFKLTSPVTHDGVEYRELSIREPKGRDLRLLLAAQNVGDAQHQLLINLTETPGEVLDEMSAADYGALLAVVTPLLEPAKKTS